MIGNCYVCSSPEQPPYRGQVICVCVLIILSAPDSAGDDAQDEDRRSLFVDVIDVLRPRQILEPGVDSLYHALLIIFHSARELLAKDHIDFESSSHFWAEARPLRDARARKSHEKPVAILLLGP